MAQAEEVLHRLLAPLQFVTPMLGMSADGALSGSTSTTGNRCSTIRRWSSSDSIEITMTSPAAPSATHSSSHWEMDRRLVVPVTTSTPSSPAASTIPRTTSRVYGPDRSRKTAMICRGAADSRSQERTYPYCSSSSSTRDRVLAPTSRRRCTTLDTVLSDNPASWAMLVNRPYCASSCPLS